MGVLDVICCCVYVMVRVLESADLYTGLCVFFFQAEDGIRDLVRSRGLGDVYKRQGQGGVLGVDAQQELVQFAQEGQQQPRLGVGCGQGLSLIHI